MPRAHERIALALVGEVMGLLELEELCEGLILALRRSIPADMSALNEVPADPPRTVSISDPEVPHEFHSAFARHAHENPLVRHHLESRDGRAIRFSDLITRRELHRLDLYRNVYRPLGIEYQIAFTLPSASTRVMGVALSRSSHDFTASERDLLNLLRPYLIQAYRNALDHTRVSGSAAAISIEALTDLGLTRRQAEVLRLVAMGRSDRDAAAELGIARRTAQKHMQLAYRALGITERSQAARLAWDATERPDRDRSRA
jgi:DNA-binding CsgD family transcriptional regulator